MLKSRLLPTIKYLETANSRYNPLHLLWIHPGRDKAFISLRSTTVKPVSVTFISQTLAPFGSEMWSCDMKQAYMERLTLMRDD